MKLYTFKYDGYGESYHVLADSPDSALDSVKRYLKDMYRLEIWSNSTVPSLPKGYSIEERGLGEVLETEVS